MYIHNFHFVYLTVKTSRVKEYTVIAQFRAELNSELNSFPHFLLELAIAISGSYVGQI
jgi:hypothetical protein